MVIILSYNYLFILKELYIGECVSCNSYDNPSECESVDIDGGLICAWIDNECTENPCIFISTPCEADECIINQNKDGLLLLFFLFFFYFYFFFYITFIIYMYIYTCLFVCLFRMCC
jgi:hypothetical protein